MPACSSFQRFGAVATRCAFASLMLVAAPARSVTIDPDERRVETGSFPAAGYVRCAGGNGSGQLVGSNRVIVTAGHVLIGQGGGSCTFTIRVNGAIRSIAIDPSSIRAGAPNPVHAPAARDWAVARLEEPVSGARPFSMASLSAGQSIRLVSARTLPGSAGVTVQACRARGRVARSGEIAIDCSAQPGDSGAALVTADGRIGGIYVGFRSASPYASAPFSDQHYNFAIPLSGAIQSAIVELSR